MILILFLEWLLFLINHDLLLPVILQHLSFNIINFIIVSIYLLFKYSTHFLLFLFLLHFQFTHIIKHMSQHHILFSIFGINIEQRRGHNTKSISFHRLPFAIINMLKLFPTYSLTNIPHQSPIYQQI